MDQQFTLRFILLTVLLAVVVTHDSEDTYNQVFNIHGGYPEPAGTRNCVTEKSMKDMMKRLFVNLTDVLEKNTERKRNLSCEETITKPRDCQDVKNEGLDKTTGIYTIYPGDGTKGIQVRCDMDTTTGGWTVIQRRVSDSNFLKTWNEYKIGFGNLSDNFWLGNDNIHGISTQNLYQLRVDLTSYDNETAFAEYGIFFIGGSDSDYRLLVDWYIGGNAGDSLAYHNGQRFSTKDRDNDSNNGTNCAQFHYGAWWYNDCVRSNLNGEYGYSVDATGPAWVQWKGPHEPMKKTEMKIRPWHR